MNTKGQIARWLDQNLSTLNLILAVVAAIASVVVGIGTSFVSKKSDQVFEAQIQDIKAQIQIDAIEAKVDAVSARLRGQALNNKGPITDDEAVAMRKSLDDLSVRMKRLEDAISSDPKRALEVPLMRRDLDNLDKSQAQAIASIKQVVDSVYDLTKWVLGGTVFVVIAVAVSNLLTARKASQPPGP